MRDFQCSVCGYKPSNNWGRLKSMQKGTFSERYKCSKCSSIYKINTRIHSMYIIFVLSLMLLSFFRIIPFVLTFILVIALYPLYLIKAPLILIKDTSK